MVPLSVSWASSASNGGGCGGGGGGGGGSTEGKSFRIYFLSRFDFTKVAIVFLFADKRSVITRWGMAIKLTQQQATMVRIVTLGDNSISSNERRDLKLNSRHKTT